MQASCPISLSIENLRNLSINELSGVEVTDALFKRFHIGRRFIVAHTAYVTELLMGPSLPVDLHPDLSMVSLAIDDHISDQQTQHLFAVGTRSGRSMPDRR